MAGAGANRFDCSKFEALFFNSARHFEALTLLTSSQLAKGRPWSAFAFADRRCRVLKPSARDHLLRAEASRMAGFPGFAALDLEEAVAIDPTDGLINFGALTWGPDEARVNAAERLSRDENASWEVLSKAIAVLSESGAAAVHGLQQRSHGWSGWIAWSNLAPIELRFTGPTGAKVYKVQRDPGHPLATVMNSAASLELHDDADALVGPEIWLGGQLVASLTRVVGQTSRRPSEVQISEPFIEPRLDVIVPIYQDLESTRACLEALLDQECEFAHRYILVNDDSPNPELCAYLDEVALRRDVVLIRNEFNLGFAGSVNKALRLCVGGDVLLLNADTVLPQRALQRLAAVARASDDIGTVTPLSNNGELTSYPRPNIANPLPSHDQIHEIDRRAQRAHGVGVVDLPNGVGFCLYVTRACLDAVGPLSEVYLRGYFEDVEFCLKGRENGFRNVCATGIYVGHAGSRSFASHKRALVVRNLAVLERRFPNYKASCAAFLAADPLRAARAAIDSLSRPEGEIVLLASGSQKSEGLAQWRAAHIASSQSPQTVLHVAVERGGRSVSLYRSGEGVPQSLAFDLGSPSELIAFREYLNPLDVQSLEIFDAPAIPESVLEPLLQASPRVNLICGDLQWFGGFPAPFEGDCQADPAQQVCSSCLAIFAAKSSPSSESARPLNRLSLALRRADTVKPLDRMGEAFSQRIFKSKAVALEASDLPAPAILLNLPIRSAVLGVLAPFASVAVDRLILRLRRSMARSNICFDIVVVGRSMDDLGLMAAGSIFVTGPASPSEYERLVAQYEIGALALLDRTGFFGALDHLAAVVGAPKAYFDWSFGTLETCAGDLALDPRICEEKAADALAFWLASIYRDDRQ